MQLNCSFFGHKIKMSEYRCQYTRYKIWHFFDVWSLDARDTQYSLQHPGTQGTTQTILDPSHLFEKVILK